MAAVVELLLSKEEFEHYRCDTDMCWGMNLVNVAKVLNSAGDDGITIEAVDGRNKVNFMFKSRTQDKITIFKMKMMDNETDLLEIPEAKYHAIARMPSSKFARICKDLISIDDTVVISVTEEGVMFSTGGDNTFCRQNTTVDKPKEATVIEMNEPVYQIYDLRYINSFTKATPLSSTVTISLASKIPVMVEYKIAAMGYIRVYLAPKIKKADEAQA